MGHRPKERDYTSLAAPQATRPGLGHGAGGPGKDQPRMDANDANQGGEMGRGGRADAGRGDGGVRIPKAGAQEQIRLAARPAKWSAQSSVRSCPKPHAPAQAQRRPTANERE